MSGKGVSYSSLNNVGREEKKVHYVDDDDFVDSAWTMSEDDALPSGVQSLTGALYPYVGGTEDYNDGSYDSSEELPNFPQLNKPPDVNLKNVLAGIFAILTGQNKRGINCQQTSSSNVSFLGSGKNGDTVLHSSVYIPSAPPLLEASGFNYSAFKDVLEAEPPEWLPDSYTSVCMQCTAPFTALTRGRHHCRFCGGIFCRVCTKGRCLLPIKFRERNPQRVCDTCYDRLDPLQGVLINSISNAVQVAKHDVLDWTCTRGWLNLPVGLSMEHEIYKASVTLRTYSQVARLNPERSIPSAILKGAKGLAILTVAKLGAVIAYKIGTGLVVARRMDGTWSAPSAVASAGLGWGAQVAVPNCCYLNCVFPEKNGHEQSPIE